MSGKLRDADVNKSYSSHFLLIFPNYNQTKKIRTRSREMRKERKRKLGYNREKKPAMSTFRAVTSGSPAITGSGFGKAGILILI